MLGHIAAALVAHQIGMSQHIWMQDPVETPAMTVDCLSALVALFSRRIDYQTEQIDEPARHVAEAADSLFCNLIFHF
jgi:hypothetical protein